MADLPWSSKGSKATLVGADESLILDSADPTPATKNKRYTMDAAGTFVAESKTYAALTTTAKTIVGAINESAAASDEFAELTDVTGAYTTASAIYKVNGTTDGLEETTILVAEPAANQFEIASGTSKLAMSANLSVTGNALIDQDVQTTASPTWAKVAAGTTDFTYVVNGTTATLKSVFAADDVAPSFNLGLTQFSDTGGTTNEFVSFRAKGTEGAPTAVADGNVLLRITGTGFDGTDYEQAGQIKLSVGNTVAADQVPGRWDFLVTDSAGVSTRAFTIDSSVKASLFSGTNINEFSIDGTLAGNSDDAVPTEQAVKTYVDGHSTNGMWSREIVGPSLYPTNAGDNLDMLTGNIKFTPAAGAPS